MTYARPYSSAARRLPVLLLVALALCLTQLSALATPARGSAWGTTAYLDAGLPTVGTGLEKVIVTARGGVEAATAAVRALGGRVGAALPLVGGVAAALPADDLLALASSSGVSAVTKDRQARFEQITYDDGSTASNFTRTTQATSAWADGNLGAGVGIAVLDTGVSSMKDFEGRLVHGPDLSGEGTTVDTYGHGTVMAGAAAGSGVDSAGRTGGAYTGVAPKATVVAVKVAGRSGAVDVSTMLQAMHWVAAYQAQYNIRVLNLSWGTASTQDPAVDPLNYAVQRLWQQGVVVVVAAGNTGPTRTTITKPADDPLVVSVGAFDDKADADDGNDSLAAWSSRGPTAQGLTKPDLVTPGRTLIASRSYGSKVEADNPKALISPSYIKGSGTSQAAAVTSGLVALLLAERPELTPDQVKRLLVSGAVPLGGSAANDQGAGRVRLGDALTADPGPARWQTSTATGLGSLEASRGGKNVVTTCPGSTASTVIIGEIDVRCEAWNAQAWAGSTWNGAAWTGSTWNGSTWNGNGSTWNGSTWNGSTWNGSTWNGSTYTTNDFTTAGYGDEFLTAFWGPGPPPGRHLPGERTQGRPSGAH